MALNKNDVPARLTRSTALMAHRRFAEGAAGDERILQMAPNNTDARYQAGFLAWQQKDYKRAEAGVYGLEQDQSQGRARAARAGRDHGQPGPLPDGIKLVEDRAGKGTGATRFRTGAGQPVCARYALRRRPSKLLQDLLKTDPKSGDLLLRLAEPQRRKGDVNAAIETFRRASQAAPTDARPLLQLGLLLDGTGRRDQAKPIYEQILKIQPDHPIALNNLAFIKAEDGQDLDEALTMAQRARQGLPNSPDIMDTLGWIYLKKNLSDDAIRTFKELVTADPNRATYHYHYGMALLQKGDKPSAKRELETAIKFNPSKDDAGKDPEVVSQHVGERTHR